MPTERLKGSSPGAEMEPVAAAPPPSLLERLAWVDKAPFAFGSGCLLGLSSPGFDLWWLAWFGLAPLLVLIQSCRRKREAWLIGLIFGCGYYLVALGWYLGLYPLKWFGMENWLGIQAAAAVWVVESMHQALLLSLFALFVFALPMRTGFWPFYRRPFYPYLISVPLIWIFIKWIVAPCQPFLGVPVSQLAYSQFRQIEVIQMAKLGGSQLVDFVLLTANAAFAALLAQLLGLGSKLGERVDRFSPRGGAAVDLGVVAAAVLVAFWWGRGELVRIYEATSLTAGVTAVEWVPHVPVAVVQGNISIEDERLGSLSAREIAARYASLSHGLGAALIVLPEGVLSSAQSQPGLLGSQLDQIAAIEKKELVAGSIEAVKGGYVNAARLITTRPEEHAHYVKRRLVPFGEFMPVGPVAYLIPDAVKRLFMGRSEGFLQARSASLIAAVWGRVGVSLCAEVVYPGLIAEEVRKGASLLINASNLAWFHGAQLNRQILAAAIMRAVENGRYMVLGTNTGISAVIDPAGFVSSISMPGRKGVLIDTVQFLYRKTPFTKMWWL